MLLLNYYLNLSKVSFSRQNLMGFSIHTTMFSIYLEIIYVTTDIMKS